MITAHVFYTLDEIRGVSLTRSLAILLLPALLLFISPSHCILAESLPKPIGSISDYGAVLNGNDRKRLEEPLRELNDEGIDVRILASRRNPFSTSSRYVDRVRSEWEIEENKIDLFLVLVREEGHWALHFQLSSELRSVLRKTGEPQQYEQLLVEKAENGDPTAVIFNSVTKIHHAVVTNLEQQEEGEEDRDPFDWGFFGIVGGSFLGFGLMIFLLWREIANRCPECGYRLVSGVRSARYEAGEADTRKYCDNCGYAEKR
ncbi:MAG: hypothetical protein ACLFO3_01835 [Candidatus Acetothermia bacterium]